MIFLVHRMKPWLYIIIPLLLWAAPTQAQKRSTYTGLTLERIEGDTVLVAEIVPVFVFPRKIDTRKFAKLVENLKKVYPIAKEANRLLQEMEKHMATLKTERERQLFTKAMERRLKKQYTPVLHRMTFSQGKLLIKLIDRETGHTSYALVKELRNGFSAFLWQGVGRIFGMNLKDTYDPTGDDEFIEMLIRLYEAGYL